MKSLEMLCDEKKEAHIPALYRSKELYQLWGMLTGVGFAGGLIFTILLSTITVLTIFAGNLPNAAVYVSAMGTGCAYMGVAGA